MHETGNSKEYPQRTIGHQTFFLIDKQENRIAVVELKTLTETPLDREVKNVLRNILDNKPAASITAKNTSLNGIRNKIKEANRQFREYDENATLPNLLFLYTERFCTIPITPQLLELALNGDTSLVTVKNVGVIGVVHKGQICKETQNTHVSAILTPNDRNGMLIIPNRWARKPVKRDVVQGPVDDWEEVQ